VELFLKEEASLPTKIRQGGVVRWGGAPLPLARWRDLNEQEKEVDGEKKMWVVKEK
jgi:hypothetical protein